MVTVCSFAFLSSVFGAGSYCAAKVLSVTLTNMADGRVSSRSAMPLLLSSIGLLFRSLATIEQSLQREARCRRHKSRDLVHTTQRRRIPTGTLVAVPWPGRRLRDARPDVGPLHGLRQGRRARRRRRRDEHVSAAERPWRRSARLCRRLAGPSPLLRAERVSSHECAPTLPCRATLFLEKMMRPAAVREDSERRMTRGSLGCRTVACRLQTPQSSSRCGGAK